MDIEIQQPQPLRPIWDALLEVYEVFAAICERHGLRYCADCGTTLGAIRHKGFIPWDDDMDIQMPRPDYDKFAKIAPRELPEGYAWVDRFNCEGFELPFGKVVITDEEKLSGVSRSFGTPLEDGIFIDIFPLDGYPDSSLEVAWRKAQEFFLNCSSRYYKGLRGCRSLRSIMAWAVGACLWKYKIKSLRDKSEFYEKRARRYPFGKTKRCISIGLAALWDDKPYPVGFFGVPRKVGFDRVEMPVQENADGYLTSVFGDYMQMPPVEKRHSSHDHSRIAPWRLGKMHGK